MEKAWPETKGGRHAETIPQLHPGQLQPRKGPVSTWQLCLGTQIAAGADFPRKGRAGGAHVAFLLGSLCVVEKVVEQIRRIQGRLVWQPERAVVLGAGPIGLLAGLLLRLEGIEVHFYATTKGGIKSDLAESMGASFIWAREHKLDQALSDEIGEVDIIVEATGFSPLAFDDMDMAGRSGIVCLTGVSGGNRTLGVPSAQHNRRKVLRKKVVFRSVNTNRSHL